MKNEIEKYVDPAMYEAAEMRDAKPKVYLLQATPDPLGAIAAACRMYEGKPTYNVNDITDEEREHYWEQVKKTHLKAPLEFVKFHFFIEGVTRAFTHQLVRQRTAVYAQESLRFAVKHNLSDEIAAPPSLTEEAGRRDQQQAWGDAVVKIEETYNYLVANGIPAEDARGLLPQNTLTRVNYCTDLRSLLDHAGNRLCTQAQFEWRQVFISLVHSIASHRGEMTGFHVDYEDYDYGGDEFPEYDNAWQFTKIATDGMFVPVCFAKGKCVFEADFDRNCSIRDRVNEGKFDEIDASEFMLDHKSARREP